MDANDLREVQAPLKERYEADPDAAQITLEAEGRLDEGIACSVKTSQAMVRAGLHPGTGGDGVAACSGDMLLEALVACAGVTMRAVASSMGLEVSGSVHAEGDLDWRGTLAVDRDTPVGFTAIRLRFDLDSTASATASSSRRWRARPRWTSPWAEPDPAAPPGAKERPWPPGGRCAGTSAARTVRQRRT